METLASLRACGLDTDAILEDRGVQQLVYLLGRAGAPIGYRFKWEAFGPFSAELAAEVSDLRREEVDAVSSEAASASAVELVRPMVEPPSTINLSRDVWLRLLTCVDFLQHYSKLPVANGDRPAFIERNFEDAIIELAKEQLATLS